MTTTQIPKRALILLVILTLVWGTNWPLFSIAVREVSVWTFRTVSAFAGGLLLLGLARLRGESLRVARADWPVLVGASLLYLVVWNVASTYSAIMIPSGQAAILGFTMPLWSALLSWMLLGEKLSPRIRVALLLGMGAVTLLLWRGLGAYGQAPLGFALGLLAAIGWAAGTLLLKRRPPRASALVLTGWQLLINSVPIALVMAAQAQGPWFMPSWTTILVITYITLVPTCIGNLTWFSIVGMLPATVAGLGSLMVPMVAMVSAALVHGDPLGPVQWVAMALSAASLALVILKPGK